MFYGTFDKGVSEIRSRLCSSSFQLRTAGFNDYGTVGNTSTFTITEISTQPTFTIIFIYFKSSKVWYANLSKS